MNIAHHSASSFVVDFHMLTIDESWYPFRGRIIGFKVIKCEESDGVECEVPAGYAEVLKEWMEENIEDCGGWV